ncbi:hypothetical protein GW17_00046931 [Ensete ventricosum]|nr:hypothetical protein GW17_00046931 [Ensete ventricosum]
MRRDLPPRYRGSHYNLYALAAPFHVITNNQSPCGRRCYLRAAPRAGAAPADGRSCLRPPMQAAAQAAGLPLVALQRAAAPCGRAVGSSPLRAGRSRSCLRGCCHYGWPPLAGGLAVAMPGCPLQGLPSLRKRSKNV